MNSKNIPSPAAQVYRSFLQGLSWSGLESVYYQSLYGAHMVGLYKILALAVFGTVGTLFSLIYLSVTLGNLGFDPSLSPFYTTFFAHRTTAKEFFIRYFLPQYLLLIVCVGAGLCLLTMGNLLNIPLSSSTLIIASCLVVTESLKRTLKHLLRLAFFYRSVALIEMTSITLYIASVYSYYFWHGTININALFGLFLLVSATTVLALTFQLLAWYRALPNNALQHLPTTITWRFTKSRIFTFLNYASTDLFSGNFLVPFVAAHSGLAHAGIFKLLATLAHNITTLLRNVFGLGSSSLFSHTKQHSHEHKQSLLQSIIMQFNCVVAFFVIVALTYTYALCCIHAVDQSLYTAALLFMLLVVGQNIVLIFEKFLIVEEKTSTLFAVYAGTMSCSFALFSLCSQLTLTQIFLLLLVLRTCTFFIIRSVSLNNIQIFWGGAKKITNKFAPAFNFFNQQNRSGSETKNERI